MLVATDGACRRNGEPTCFALGVAWIMRDDGDMLYHARYEHNSTSQRGELMGIILALEYAVDNLADEEPLIIVTDSEYMYNTIMRDWVMKWARNGWRGSDGNIVKNPDMWEYVHKMLQNPKLVDNVFMQWTKGHLISYTAGNVAKAMRADDTGIELYDRIMATANRDADKHRIVDDFNYNRIKHSFNRVPENNALQWAIANTMADSLASYLVKVFDDLLV